jgi:hypothetical protein
MSRLWFLPNLICGPAGHKTAILGCAVWLPDEGLDSVAYRNYSWLVQAP